jgi:glutathione synthase/RimK-type ligase-like ATP-grasp enzyme
VLLRIATCRPLPEPDVDEDVLLRALRARGIDARMAAWNDPGERWDERVPTVIRSTWDYIHDLRAFRAWLDRAERAAPLWNPGAVVRDNLHKRYLLDLERQGIPIVPTVLIGHAARTTIAPVLALHGWSDVVVKPAVGAGSYGTQRFRAHELAAAGTHFEQLLDEHRDVLVQPYEVSVEEHGERALVWIDGAFTHAVRKTPRFGDDPEHVSEALAIESDERELGERALAPHAAQLLYARVDVARGPDGSPRVMELELVEPSLFLRQSPEALERLAEGIARRLR